MGKVRLITGASGGIGGALTRRCLEAGDTVFAVSRRPGEGLVVLALHPGTVDTALSRPFQRNVPEGKLFTPDFAAERLLGLIDGAGEADSGRFLAWDGKDIPW